MASTRKTITIFLLTLFFLSKPVTLFATGMLQKPPEAKAVSEIQERYNALTAPGIIMLPITGASAVAHDFLVELENELNKQLVIDGKLKPVKMQNWLLATFTNKADNPFAIINAIRAEQYNLPLQYIGKPVVFRDGSQYYFALYVYPLATYYPLIIFRQLASLNTVDDMIASCIEELHVRLSQPVSRDSRKRVVMDDFKLEFFRLAEHSSGEFDFIAAPFIEKRDTTLREGDDFFSRAMGYILASTNLFQIFQVGDFKEYSNAVISANSTLVDYRIQGRIQFTEQVCVLYVDVFDVRSGVGIISLRHPLLSYSFVEVWNAYRQISVQIIAKLFNQESYGVISTLTSPGRGFFANNMFVGWGTLENFVLVQGSHIISTGSSYRISDARNTVNSYYIILDNQSTVYTDREGRRIWNLLNK
ncbi:MAG: hypothetical protein LBI28_03690 [Treponema sp.]|jgi:hypothetical protein|nr:hypothetical protein [Treponema sp.]